MKKTYSLLILDKMGDKSRIVKVSKKTIEIADRIKNINIKYPITRTQAFDIMGQSIPVILDVKIIKRRKGKRYKVIYERELEL